MIWLCTAFIVLALLGKRAGNLGRVCQLIGALLLIPLLVASAIWQALAPLRRDVRKDGKGMTP